MIKRGQISENPYFEKNIHIPHFLKYVVLFQNNQGQGKSIFIRLQSNPKDIRNLEG